MPGAHLSVQNYIGFRLGLSAACAINLTNLLRRIIKGCCLQ